MSKDQMLLKLLDCCEQMDKARKDYEKHPGGGASQKIKNRLAQQYKIKLIEMNNAVFNIRQLLK